MNRPLMSTELAPNIVLSGLAQCSHPSAPSCCPLDRISKLNLLTRGLSETFTHHMVYS